jgi:tetratricopeptide (TPR) repeat protein
MILQIIPLDMTVCETWFYFPGAGVLGMIGVAVSTLSLPKVINRKVLIGAALIVFLLLGVRSALRGPDWSNAYTLAAADITASPTNYVAAGNLAWEQLQKDNVPLAYQYSEASVNIFPSASAYSILGLCFEAKGNYPAALNAYAKFFYYDGGDLDFWKSASIYENMGAMELVTEPLAKSLQFLNSASTAEPTDSTLWTYLAIAQFASGNDPAAKTDIVRAAKYGQVQPAIYNGISEDQPFTANLTLIGKTVNVQ